jgi:hypothetical protein
MRNAGRRVLPFIIAAGILTAGGGAFLRRSGGPTIREVEAVITFVDVENREAAIETTHPKSGAAIELSGEVPPQCAITINGQPAKLADLEIGDQVVVRGYTHRVPDANGKKGSKRFIAESIRVTR